MSTAVRRALWAVLPFLAFGSLMASARPKPIGGFIVSAADQRFHIGDGTTGSQFTSNITVQCALGDITTNNPTIYIPAGLGLIFDTTFVPTLFSASAPNLLNAVTPFTYTSDTSLRLNVINNFAGNQVVIGNVKYKTFSTASSGKLWIDKNNNGIFDPASDMEDTKTLTVAGNGTINAFPSQVFRTNDGPTATSEIVVTDHATFPGIWQTTNLRIRIPSTVDMEFNTAANTISALTPLGVVKTNVSSTASFTFDRKTAVINIINTDFVGGEAVHITGLEFTDFAVVSAGTGRLELEVNNQGTLADLSGSTVRIASLPTMSSQIFESYTTNDPATVANQIVITDAVDVAMINATNDLRITIPGSLNMVWDPAITSVTTRTSLDVTPHGKVSGAGVVCSGKTAFIPVSGTFGIGEVVKISGLRLMTFGAASSGNLTLDVNNNGVADATDAFQKAVGTPTITYAAASYNAGEEPTLIPPITVKDDASNPRITVAGDIRVHIPGGLGAVWDTLTTTATLSFSGGTTGSASTTVVIEPGEKILRLNVSPNFTAGRQVQISGLKFRSFTQSTGKLSLEVSGAGTFCGTGANDITIGGAPSIVSATQTFTVGDPPTLLASPIRVADAATVPMISNANHIKIIIPSGVNMTWDTSVTTVTALTDLDTPHTKVTGTGLTYPGADPKKTVLIPVGVTPFTSGEAVKISGLKFSNFTAPTGSDVLQLEVDGDVDPEASTVGTKAVGQPTLTYAATGYNQGEEPTLAPVITVTDDPTTARIRDDLAAGEIRIKIPGGLGMIWDDSVTTVSLSFSGGSGVGNVDTTVLDYEDLDKTVVLNVTSNFGAGRSVQITGLKFKTFTSGTGKLELEVNNAGTTCFTGANDLTIGGRPTLTNGLAQSFTYNDPSTVSTSVANPFIVQDASLVAMIKPATGIRLRIPTGLNMTWDTSMTTFTSSNGKVTTGTPGFENSNKTLVLTVNAPFSAGESVTLSNLRFAGFSSGTGSVELEIDDDTDVDAVATTAKSIGRPMISSAGVTFNEGEEATAGVKITVTEDAAVPRIRLDNATGNIRVRIPSGLSMIWDTLAPVVLTVTGGGSGTVAPGVSYEDAEKTMVIDVLTDFAGVRAVEITGHLFKNFSASGPLGLELEVNASDTVCRTDAGLIQIGGRVSISSASQSFIVGDPSTTVSSITVQDAPGVPMITTAGDIRIKLPAGLGASWDTSAATINAGGHAKINTTVTFEPGGNPNPTTAVINVITGNFAANESVTISGLKLKGFTAAGTGSLEVEVDGDVAVEDVDGGLITIGAPTISLTGGSRIYTKGDPAIANPQIVVTEHANGASIKAAREIRITIPSAAALIWDTNDTTATFGGTAFLSGKVPNVAVVFESNKTVRVAVDVDFAAGNVLTIDNLTFFTFSGSSAGLGLQLEVDLDSDVESTSAQTLAVGAPTIQSLAPQSFNVSDGSTAASPITIQDDANNPRIKMAATGEIRIRIPAGLGMSWDTAFNTIAVQPKIGTTVTFEPALSPTPSVAVIDVTADFAVNDSVTITGLQLHTFSESAASRLELVVNGVALTTCNVDGNTKQVGGQVLLSSTSQTFTRNDPPTAAATITIQDAPGTPKITAANDIRLKIPAGVDMKWDITVTTVTALTDLDAPHSKVSGTGLIYADLDKTVIIPVGPSDFVANEVVKISGLRFANFAGASSPLPLTLELDADVDAESTDSGTKGIGAPILVSNATQVFPVLSPPQAASSFTITDDSTVPRIRDIDPLSDLRVRIPAGLNMIWDTTILTPSVVMGGPAVAGAVDAAVTYDGTGKILILNVTQNFGTGGRSVTVSGLAFKTFSAASVPASLELETNNLDTVAATDTRTKAIQGSPMLSSASQTFSRNDPSALASTISVTDAGGVGAITTSGNIRIKIPAGLSMTWDTTVTTINTSAHPKLSTSLLAYEDSGKTAVIDVVNADFNQSEAATIAGLRFANFSAASPAALPLTLELNGTAQAEATDAGTKGIGAPSLQSAFVQVFQVGAGPTAAAAFTITEDPVIPRIRDDVLTGELRVKIPAGLNMVWNTSVTTATVQMGGLGTLGAVSGTVGYDFTEKILILDVTQGFDAGRTVTVSGLSFRSFTSPSTPTFLELEVNNAGTSVGADATSKAIQGAPQIASAGQQFTRRDPSTAATSIAITDAGGVPTITQTGNLRIRIPAGLDMTWDTTVTTITTGSGKISTSLILPYEDAGKTAVVDVSGDFLQGENAVISGLRFANFNAAGSGQLELITVSGGPVAAVDGGAKAIGAPTILSGANQGFNVGDPTTPISPITITEDPVTARVRADNLTGDIRITIPSGFNMIWDTTDTTAVVNVTGPGSGAASNIVSYENSGRTLRIDVTTGLATTQSLTLSGVSFTAFNGTSPMDNLELDLSNAGTVCDEDGRTIVIGALPTIASAADQAFTIGDPATPISTITVTEAAGNGMLRKTRDFRIVIPLGFPMVWNTDDTAADITVLGAGPGTASSTVSFPGGDGKTLQIDVTEDFAPGQSLTIAGLSFRNFTAAAVGGTLGLDVDLDPALETATVETLAIGAPSISSDASQTFTLGDPATPISRIVIQDGVVARVTQGGDLRVRIPSSLAMTFDTTDVTPTFGGAAAGKVAPGVTYQGAGKILVINVTGDFGPGEILTIQDLSFTNFSAASNPAPLELEVNNLGTVADLDDKTKAIGGFATLSSSASQIFTTGDPATSAGTIVVTDAPSVATITDAQNIRIKIPAGLPMVWDTTATAVLTLGPGSGTAPSVSYQDNEKTLVVEVDANFSPLQTLTITGLRFRDFSGASGPVSLMLEIDGDATPEATDDKTKTIGAPFLLSGVNQKFGVGDLSTPISPITISEDGVTARIVADAAAGDIRVRIPLLFGMTWDVNDTVATIGGPAQLKVSPIVTFEDAGRTLVLDVTADFGPTDAITVSDLAFHPFSAASSTANLELEVNNAADAVADLDGRTILVGTRPSIVGAVTSDTNGNGSIDRITVTFDEDVDGNSSGVLSAAGFTLAGFTIPFGQRTGVGTVVFYLPESGLPNTGATPNLSYDPTLAGGLLDADEGLEPKAYGPIPVTDGAPPRIVGLSFEDPDSDGHINTITFTLSETLLPGQEDVDDWLIIDGDGSTHLMGAVTDLDIVGNQIIFTLDNLTGTATLPRYRYQSDLDGLAIQDLANLLLPNQTNNTPPVANAGVDRTFAPTLITLDGSASSDRDGQPLSFSWAPVPGPLPALLNPTSATPSFVGIAAGTYVFELTVDDGLTTAVDSVTITVQNLAPTADAGVDRTVFASAAVTLDASASIDVNGDAPLTYKWAQVSGPVVILAVDDAVTLDFTAPAVAAALAFEVTVSDPAGNSAKDTVVVRVNVSGGNGVPTADAGGDRTGVVGVGLTLDGRKSVDPDGDALSYAWSSVLLLANPFTATPTFTPAVPGNYTFTLVVTDANGAVGLADTVRVVVLPAGSANHPPIPAASPLPGDTVFAQTPVTFDGSASVDPEGDAIRYAWVQVGGPRAILSDASASSPTFIPVVPGTYSYQLTVTDGSLASFPLLVEVKVVPALGAAPNAVAALNPADADGRVLFSGAPIDLDASGSVGSGLSYAWSQVEGPPVPIAAFDTAAPSFTPTAAGTYTFALLVRDADGLIDVATLTVVVDTAANEAPTAAAGADASASAGATVTLDGSGSADPADADAVTTFGTGLLAFWRQVSGPAVSLSDAGSASPTFVPTAAGAYQFELVVGDGAALSASDTVVVTVTGSVVASGGGSSSGGGCGLTGFDALLALALAAAGRRLRRRR